MKIKTLEIIILKISINIPINLCEIEKLKISNIVSVNGYIITLRDKAHKYIYERMIINNPEDKDIELFNFLKKYLKAGIIYHCGPIVKKENNKYKIISAGPTTSIREEMYIESIIKKFGVKGIIGKGGMGQKTLKALKENKSIYLHAVGGNAVKIAESIINVMDVKKLEFGIPEAIWLIEVKNFFCYVTMDSYGSSLHKEIEEKSIENYNKLFGLSFS